MTKMVYGIASGQYSDYSVHCIVETEDEARKLVEKLNRTKDRYQGLYEIQELPMVDSTVERQSVLYLNEILMDSGKQADRHESTRLEWPWEGYDFGRAVWRWIRAPFLDDKGGRLELHGTDHDLVRKIFEEKRAALIMDDAYRAQHEMRGAVR